MLLKMTTTYDVEVLLNAVLKGHLSKVKKDVADNGSEILQLTNSDALGRFTALHLASKRGQINMVRFLCENGANIDASNLMGETPIYLAALKGHDEVLQYLVTKKADINKATNNGTTPLAKAAKEGHKHMVVFLTEKGAKADCVDSFGLQPIHHAARGGHLDVVTCLVKDQGVNTNVLDARGFTPLHYSANAGHLAVSTFLVENHADVEQADVNGSSPIYYAANAGHLSILMLLAPHMRNVDVPTKFGVTPLFLAARENHLPIVQYLLEVGADMNQINPVAGKTPFEVAGPHVLPLFELKKLSMTTDDGQTAILALLQKDGWQLWFHMLCARFTSSLVKDLMHMFPAVVAAKVAEAGPPVAPSFTDGMKIEANFQEKGVYLPGTIVRNRGGGEFDITYDNGGNEICVDKKLIRMLGGGNSGSGVVVPKQDVINVRNDRSISTYYTSLESIGLTPLHIYAHHGNAEMVVYLLRHMADRHAMSNDAKSFIDVMSDHFKLTLVAKGELAIQELQHADHALWFHVAKQDDTIEGFEALQSKVKDFVAEHPDLARAKDLDGRIAIEVASAPIRSAMQSVLLWHGRYRITESGPEHMSNNCFVFKAVDESDIDKETNQPRKVALKLMRVKAHFVRELNARRSGFNEQHVMGLYRSHPSCHVPATSMEASCSMNASGKLITQMDTLESMEQTLSVWANEVRDVAIKDVQGMLVKTEAEKMFMMVMPWADRNMFVALKQVPWAGKDMKEVGHVFSQLVHGVENMHDNGYLHGDIKTLNIIRSGSEWKFIDLDASCQIGIEHVGYKYSSAYVPPEAIYVDENTGQASVRVVGGKGNDASKYQLLIADPSFDVWSLGCVLYQMCTVDVRPLFQGGQDDNLTDDINEEDNLFALAEWSPELKTKKLARVTDKMARNLLSQMLHKDPLQRPTLARVLAHTFVSGKKVARLVGEKPKYDVFLSYRVAADAHHVEKLYNMLTAQGFKVYWDKLCLEPGVDWEQGFCEGLVSSRAFVPLLSRDAINHPDKAWQNFSKLTADQPNCDNVFLEHRLAVELQGLGLIEKIFPVFIGNLDEATSEYSDYFKSGCHPALPDTAIKSVEEKLRHHMESQALGTPLEPDRTVKSVVGAITACQGAFIVGPTEATFAAASASIAKMLTDVPMPANVASLNKSPRGGTHVHNVLLDSKQAEISRLKEEIDALRAQKEAALGSLRGDILAKFDNVKGLASHLQALLQG